MGILEVERATQEFRLHLKTMLQLFYESFESPQ